MYRDVKIEKPLSDYRLYVEIADRRKGVFDMKPYLNQGVFQELRNVSYFSLVDMVLGAVTRPHEQAIAPETLLAQLQSIESSNHVSA